MKTNRLAQESSPYLLQHSNNPVEWFPWGEEALIKARTEDKPIIVSIGYSACHWCHVMERESFENEPIAAIMNKYFVSIKIDREERPDVDAIYMDAIQAMGLRGGWPLNVFLMPDTKPFYGGTYFPPKDWTNILYNVREAFDTKRQALQDSANGFTENMLVKESEKYNLSSLPSTVSGNDLEEIFERMSRNFDKIKGGMNRTPKFPMPSIWKFLLRYYSVAKDEKALNHLKITLDRIALGGIYDQIGGGWARYSTDADWMVPHFEKMLYDNGQLVSIYAEMYNLTKDNLYKQRVYQTIDWLEREMTHAEGGFYSAQDADSEGEEGKFYVWKLQEIEQILGQDAAWFSELYDMSDEGNWEHGNNILHTEFRVENYFNELGWEENYAEKKLNEAHQKLFLAREKRIRPGLDDKILCSWNGLMLKGLADAYRVFGEQKFLDLALKNANFIHDKMTVVVVNEEGKKSKGLWHNYKNGKATITAYLEDYAAVIEAYISIYQATFDEKWLHEAQQLADYSIANFYDVEDEFFYFTDTMGEALIARKKELFDNVISASNSIMAENLFWLGIITERTDYQEISQKMLAKMQPLINTQTEWLTNWACLATYQIKPTAEVAIVGENALEIRQQLEQDFNPNRVFVGTKTSSELPLLQNRTAINDETTMYVCFDKVCQLPTSDIEVARRLIEEI